MRVDSLEPFFVNQIPPDKFLSEGKIYISKKFGVAIHLCACGCGGECITDLKPEFEDGWTLTDKNGLVTISPSIGNWRGQSPYHAHYYITENKIEWL